MGLVIYLTFLFFAHEHTASVYIYIYICGYVKTKKIIEKPFLHIAICIHTNEDVSFQEKIITVNCFELKIVQTIKPHTT